MDNSFLFIMGGVLLAAIVLFVVISRGGGGRKHIDREEFRARWRRVEQLQAQGEAGWHLAVMEADKLLDQALKATGKRGETMGHRLKNARTSFSNNDAIWQAHKLRNRLAHEHDVHINTAIVTQALSSFELGLRDLGVL